MSKSSEERASRRSTRQREAGAVTRAETRRRVLAAAIEVFAEHGYVAATVSKIAERADVSVQSLYSAWGNKRGLLRGMMESQVLGDQPGALTSENLPMSDVGDVAATGVDSRALIAYAVRQFRSLAERAALGWQTYAQAAAVDPEAAEDWQALMNIRRLSIRSIVASIPAEDLRPGLTPDTAGDTAWVIASPHTHEQLVVTAGFTYDEFEEWVRTTLIAALLRPAG
ncbi:TetR/AcrR family transcriptional regulator [Gordonia sp. NPDC127522]|uniref:TetR/AcrR family transcriptional regulator n=1 Tax=Gordonia sp. NPDC127522 TaxID=3345390 RepID=UPI003628AD8A